MSLSKSEKLSIDRSFPVKGASMSGLIERQAPVIIDSRPSKGGSNVVGFQFDGLGDKDVIIGYCQVKPGENGAMPVGFEQLTHQCVKFEYDIDPGKGSVMRISVVRNS